MLPPIASLPVLASWETEMPLALCRLTNYITLKPSMAISIWSARSNPADVSSVRLKAFNQDLITLCDATGFDRSVESVCVATPQFTSMETESAWQASCERVDRLIDTLHTTTLNRGSTIILFVSRVGRLKLVSIEMVAVRNNNGEIVEFISCETQLPDYFPLPSAMELREAQRQEAISMLIQHRHQESQATTLPASRKRVERYKNAPDFVCTLCGQPEYRQRRRGPLGANTLCNRCGLRWQKQQRSACELENPSCMSQLQLR